MKPTHAYVRYAQGNDVLPVFVSEIQNFRPENKEDFDSKKKYKVFWPSKIVTSKIKNRKPHEMKKDAFYDAYILCLGGSELETSTPAEVSRLRPKGDNSNPAILEEGVEKNLKKQTNQRKVSASEAKDIEIMARESENYKKKCSKISQKLDETEKEKLALIAEIERLKRASAIPHSLLLRDVPSTSKYTAPDLSVAPLYREPLSSFMSLQCPESDVSNDIGEKTFTPLLPRSIPSYKPVSKDSQQASNQKEREPPLPPPVSVADDVSASRPTSDTEDPINDDELFVMNLNKTQTSYIQGKRTPPQVLKALMGFVWTEEELARKSATGQASNRYPGSGGSAALTPAKKAEILRVYKNELVRRRISSDAIDILMNDTRRHFTDKCKQVKAKLAKKA